MGLAELFFIAVGLSMDAFAVSLCKGLAMGKFRPKTALTIGLFFGGFQAAMPLLGWLLGNQFERYITSVDHWIAFGLLAFIGGKMLFDAFHDDGGCDESCKIPSLKELFVLAVATSIDALAVGITFSFLKVDIIPAVTFIGLITFALSVAGVAIGAKFGAKFEKKAQIAGGIVLIVIGLKILLEHLGLFG